MPDPLISIITPNYNMGKFLDKAISSVIDQSYHNWELIIVDNFSSDNTLQIIKQYDDKRIKFIQNNNNGIIAISRNLGINHANGSWIAFLDSDDIWYQKRLEIIVNEINNNFSAELFTTDELLVDLNTNQKKNLIYGRKLIKNVYKSLLIYGNLFSPSATIIKKEFLIKKNILFREDKNFITAEDYDFWLQIFKAQAKYCSIRLILGEFRVHGDNNSKKNNLHIQNVKNVIFNHVDSLNISKKKKEKLRYDILTRLEISNIKFLFLNRDRLKCYTKIIYLFSNNPIFMIKYFFLKLLKN